MAEAEQATRTLAGWAGGEVLFAGGTDWAKLGRSGGKLSAAEKEAEVWRQEKYPNLPAPTRLKAIMGVRIAFVAAGSTAAHCIIGDTNGACYTWGRNEKGQLGHGDTLQRNLPTLVSGLHAQRIVTGGGGKHHTALVTSTGHSFTFGLNTQGQCGTGAIKKPKGAVTDDLLLTPAKALVEAAVAVSCGADFTVWRCEGGRLMSCGHPIYGQLGDGSDHMYNAKETSIKIVHDPQPTPRVIAALAGVNVTAHACGASHTIAVDDAGGCYTWGNGNYGKLGHKVQQDELLPRLVESFSGRMAVPKGALVSAGGTSCLCTGPGGQLYGWGKLKVSGENNTHPTPIYDLQGWHLRHIASGPGTYAVCSGQGDEAATITWGAASNGELGYGPNGKKSAANPGKVEDLDKLYCHQVAAGVGFTLFLVDPSDSARLDGMPVFEPSTAADAAEVVDEEGKGSGKGAAKAAGAKRKGVADGGKGKKGKK